MKTQDLLETIQKVLPAVDSKSVVSQTDHLIFGNELVAAYNGRISISTPIDTDIECSVPATDLLKIIKSIKDKEVELSVEDDLLHVVSDKVNASISTEIDEEMALQAIRNFDIDDLLDGTGSEVPETLIDGIRLSQYSASKNADDPKNLNCICIDKNLVMAGDGYRATVFDTDSDMPKILLPLSSAVELCKHDPEAWIIDQGWWHLLNPDDTIFSARIVHGDFPDIQSYISGFQSSVEVDLPDELREVAGEMGDIAESPVENFRIIEVNLIGESIECHVSKNGVSATKRLDFKGNDQDLSFLISANMLISIMDITNMMSINESAAMFSDGAFSHIIMLVQS